MLDCCAPLDTVKVKGITMSTLACLARCNGLTVEISGPDTHTIEDLRAVIEECTQKDHGKVLVVSYDRRGVNQTGTGHFSPVGGYHRFVCPPISVRFCRPACLPLFSSPPRNSNLTYI